MSEKAPLTTTSIRHRQRKAPELSAQFTVAPSNPMEWSNATVYSDQRQKAPTNPDQWSARLNQIHKEDMEQGNYWRDETNLDWDAQQEHAYISQRRDDFLAEHVPTRIQELGYEIDHEFETFDSNGNRIKTSLEVQNPQSRIGELMLLMTTPDVRRQLKDKFKEINPDDTQFGANVLLANSFMKAAAQRAYEQLLNQPELSGENAQDLIVFLGLAQQIDKQFVVKQFVNALERQIVYEEAQHRQVNMGGIARLGVGIQSNIEDKKHDLERWYSSTKKLQTAGDYLADGVTMTKRSIHESREERARIKKAAKRAKEQRRTARQNAS